jgi:putative transposase
LFDVFRGYYATSDDSERHRRSPRLRGYDYGLAGVYFVTICTQERMLCFGRVADDLMLLSPAGLMVQEVWGALPVHYPGIDLDVCIVMPDHIHWLCRADGRGAAA